MPSSNPSYRSEKTLWDIAYEEKLKIETSYREPGMAVIENLYFL